MDSAFGTIKSSEKDTVETFRFDPTNEDLIVDIAEAIASAANVDVLDLDPRLNDVIDADALTQCLCSADETLRISFSLGRHRITATGSGTLRIAELG